MRWQRAVDAALRPLDLTHSQFLLLDAAERALRDAKQPVMQRQVAEVAGLDEGTTSNIVKRLEQRGLITRKPPDGDARAWRITVPGRGKTLLERARKVVGSAAARFFAS